MAVPPVQLFRRTLNITGTTDFPHVNADPRNIFMRRIKARPAVGRGMAVTPKVEQATDKDTVAAAKNMLV